VPGPAIALLLLDDHGALHAGMDIGSFHPENLSVTIWNSFFFRQNQNDAVYGGTYFGNQNAPGANPYQITALSRGQFIGQEPNLRLYWAFAPHFNYGLEVAYRFSGPALKVAGAKDPLYVRAPSR
jgi:hypothetical protein